MAGFNQRNSGLALLVSLAFLVFLGWYVWQSTEVHVPGQDVARDGPEAAGPDSNARLSAVLEVDPAALASAASGAEPRPVLAQLRLHNAGDEPLAVLDAPLPSLLVTVRLYFLGRDGRQAPREVFPALPLPVTTPPPRADAQGRRIAVSHHSVVLLLPGRELTVPLPLRPPFDVRSPGHYRLEACYQPAEYARNWALNLGALAVAAPTLTPEPVRFEVQPPRPAGEKP